MVKICCIAECRSNYPSTIKTEGKVSLFSFPIKDPLREAWLKLVQRDGFTPTHHSFVCIKHFVESDVLLEKRHGNIVIPYKYPRLKPEAIPRIFPTYSDINKTAVKPKDRKRKNKTVVDPKSRTPKLKKVAVKRKAELIESSVPIVSTSSETIETTPESIKEPNGKSENMVGPSSCKPKLKEVTAVEKAELTGSSIPIVSSSSEIIGPMPEPIKDQIEKNEIILSPLSYKPAAVEKELIGSSENFKSLLSSKIRDFDIDVKFHNEDVYLYKIQFPNFVISHHAVITKDLSGQFYYQSVNIKSLNQQYQTWVQFKTALNKWLTEFQIK